MIRLQFWQFFHSFTCSDSHIWPSAFNTALLLLHQFLCLLCNTSWAFLFDYLWKPEDSILFLKMASVIEDAETYQQSGLILDADGSDLVPLTNPAASADLTVLRRTSSLGTVSRCKWFTKFNLISFISVNVFIFHFQLFSWHWHFEHHLPDYQCSPGSRSLKLPESFWSGWRCWSCHCGSTHSCSFCCTFPSYFG